MANLNKKLELFRFFEKSHQFANKNSSELQNLKNNHNNKYFRDKFVINYLSNYRDILRHFNEHIPKFSAYFKTPLNHHTQKIYDGYKLSEKLLSSNNNSSSQSFYNSALTDFKNLKNTLNNVFVEAEREINFTQKQTEKTK